MSLWEVDVGPILSQPLLRDQPPTPNLELVSEPSSGYTSYAGIDLCNVLGKLNKSPGLIIMMQQAQQIGIRKYRKQVKTTGLISKSGIFCLSDARYL